MRSFVLIAGSFALLVGLFVGYTMWQTGTVHAPSGPAAPVGPIVTRGGASAIVGATERPWVTTYDANWRPTLQFRAADFEPQEGDRVFVRQAEARFFLGGGEAIRVRGAEGTVVMANLPRPGQDPREAGRPEPPSRGELKTVEVELFDSAAAMEADTEARDTSMLRVTMDNAAFDNETFRIYTDDSVIDGRPVPASQIPVVVTGRDYDFEGEGLTIRWNERDRRLELLRVNKGHRLVVKNPGAFESNLLRNRKGAAKAEARPLPVLLAATDDAATAQAIKAQATEKAKPAYRATLSKNLRILRGEQELIRGDELFIDFMLEQRGKADPTTAPTTAPVVEVPSASTTGPTDALTKTPPTTAPRAASQPPTAATTQPLPLTIFWDGELLVEPLPSEVPAPAASEATVHVTGSPLRITEQGSEVTCGSMLYDSASQTLSFDRDAAFPLVMRDPSGARVDGTSVTYALPDRLAIFRGRTSALLPVKDKPDAPPRALSATWTERATLQLAEGGGGGAGGATQSLVVERADLAGDVQVEHPSLNLTGKSLQLIMEPSSAGAKDMILRELTATGDVNVVISQTPEQSQSIAGQKVHVRTAVDAEGKLYPREIRGDGRVVAKDADQTFTAEHLVATLRPAAKGGEAKPNDAQTPQVELEHLVAMGGAEYSTADGKVAAADQIEVTNPDGEPVITLLGEAKVGQAANTLYAPHVQVLTKEQLVKVLGAGTLDAVREVREGDRPRPIAVEWKQGVTVDGSANRVDVDGNVVVTTSENDGTTLAITADKLLMGLTDAPKSTQAEPPKRERRTPQLLQDKAVRDITFGGAVEVQSLRTTPAGGIVRRMNLSSRKLLYDAAGRKMTVPEAGRLLFQDHPEAEAAATQPATRPAGDKSEFSGDTAMKWERQLVYDEANQVITLEGSVLIVHESTDPGDQDGPGKPQRFDLESEMVRAELSRKPTDAVTTTQPAAAEPELSRLVAERDVRFRARGVNLRCQRIEYDPVSGWLTATGTEDRPVEVVEGVSRGTFREARYNLRTEQLKVEDIRGQIRR